MVQRNKCPPKCSVESSLSCSSNYFQRSKVGQLLLPSLAKSKETERIMVVVQTGFLIVLLSGNPAPISQRTGSSISMRATKECREDLHKAEQQLDKIGPSGSSDQRAILILLGLASQPDLTTLISAAEEVENEAARLRKSSGSGSLYLAQVLPRLTFQGPWKFPDPLQMVGGKLHLTYISGGTGIPQLLSESLRLGRKRWPRRNLTAFFHYALQDRS